MKLQNKVILGVSSLFIILILIGVYIAYSIVTDSIPNYSGEHEAKAVNEQVDIYRDSLGIPYIEAQNDKDAAFALGYVHAQERLFQMDLIRRAAAGRLSEVFGAKTVPFDRMFKTLGLNRVALENYEILDDNLKNLLISYSNGVNYFIKNNKDKLPLEFSLLEYKPYNWKPQHSLLIAKMLAWELNISWWTDFAFTHLVNKFGEERGKELLPHFEQNKSYIISKNVSSIENLSKGLVETDKLYRKFIGFDGTHIGSNNWVVDGNHSESSKPIIANDPHLSFQAPARWFIAVMKIKDLTFSGFTLPGLPAIVIGKTDYISWAVTNVMADDADFYTEQLDSLGNNYLVDGNWKKLNKYSDTIYVKDGNLEVIETKLTHRGPIISDIHPYNFLYPNKKRKNSTVSMRWTALDKSKELSSFLDLNRAQNFNQFKEALRNFYSPGQNFVYADINGNIGYVCAARLPIRSNTSPTLVYDGTKSSSDWKGFVSYDEMPKLYNPASGFIATANNKVSQNFPYHISNLWEPDSRIDRINTLLQKKQKHSINDFMHYQNDYYSVYASQLVPYILQAFDGAKIKDKNLELSIKLFKRWDYNFSAESQTPTIYARFLQNLIFNIFADEMCKTYLKEYSFIANIPYRVVMQLLKEENSIWFDNVKTKEKYETKDDIIRKSLVDALISLEKESGKDLYLWQWGNYHTVTFKHSFSGQSKLLDKFINVGPFPIGGDGTTINNGEYSFNKPYKNNLGPSMRFIYDFADKDNFYCILTTGQSGHQFSENYKNMTELWLKGKYIKVNTNIEKNKSLFADKTSFIPAKD